MTIALRVPYGPAGGLCVRQCIALLSVSVVARAMTVVRAPCDHPNLRAKLSAELIQSFLVRGIRNFKI